MRAGCSIGSRMFRPRLSLDPARRRAIGGALILFGLRLGLPFMGTATFATTAEAAELSFDIRVDKGRVPENMRLIRAKQGDVVKLRWHVDSPMVLHLHGYDIEKRVQPD